LSLVTFTGGLDVASAILLWLCAAALLVRGRGGASQRGARAASLGLLGAAAIVAGIARGDAAHWLLLAGAGALAASVALALSGRYRGAGKRVAESRGFERWDSDIASHIRDVFWVVSNNLSRTLYVSPAFEQIWGIDPGRLYDSPNLWMEAVDPADRAMVEAAFAAMGGGSEYDLEYRIVRPDGEERWIHDRGFPVRGEAGEISRFVGVSEDISGRKLADAALRERETRLEAILENISDGFITANRDGVCTFVNTPAAASIGKTKEELMGASLRDLYPELAQAPPTAAADQARSTGKPATFLNHYPPLDRWFEGTVYPQDDGTIAFYFRDVTEQRMAQEALRQSEETAQALINAYTSPAFLIDTAGTVLAGNDVPLGQLGTSASGLVGSSIWDVLPADVAERRKEWTARVVETRAPLRAVDERDGRTVDSQVYPVLDEAGNVTRLAIYAQDVTDRRQAEAALAESERMLRLAQEIAHLGYWTLNLETSDLAWSDEIYRIFEVDPRRFEATYEAFLQTIHPEDREMVNEAYTRSVEERTSYAIVHRLLMADGRVKWVQEQGQTEYAEDGRPARSVGTVHDITAIKETEALLRASEARMRAIFEAEPECVNLLDREGRVVAMNPAGLAMMEAETLDEVLGAPAASVVVEADRQAFLDLTRRVLAGESGELEFEICGLEGTHRFLETHATPLRGADGEVETVLGVTRDITERKRAEVLTLRALHEKETLLKEIHHRVKNNLAIVVELLSMQRHREEFGSARDALLESENRVYAMALVHEMLYRSEDLAAIDLGQHVERICQQLAQTYEGNVSNVRIRTHVDSIALSLDRAIPFSLVLNELVSNAFKHAFPGGRKGTLDVSVTAGKDGYTSLEVRDDGVGLNAAIDPQRSPSLGLRLVHSLARQLEAVVEVTREPGTTFRLTFRDDEQEVKVP
jgi:PAS domain S-box-containing protein